MPTFKQFSTKGLSVRFFPEEKSLVLMPQKIKKSDFAHIKSKLETMLQVDYSNQNRDGSIVLKLDDQSSTNVEELLRSMGFTGGEQIAGLGENLTASHVLDYLFESTYRTGEYWKSISDVTGKNKNNLTDQDVFSVRKLYTRKPATEQRDEVLRSLDKAMRYFARKMRDEQGEDAAEHFKDEYRSIGDLVPSDYSGEGIDDGPDFGTGGPGNLPNDSNKLSLDNVMQLPYSDESDEAYDDVERI